MLALRSLDVYCVVRCYVGIAMFRSCANMWVIHLSMLRLFSILQSVYICVLPTLLNMLFSFSSPGLKVVGSIQLHTSGSFFMFLYTTYNQVYIFIYIYLFCKGWCTTYPPVTTNRKGSSLIDPRDGRRMLFCFISSTHQDPIKMYTWQAPKYTNRGVKLSPNGWTISWMWVDWWNMFGLIAEFFFPEYPPWN